MQADLRAFDAFGVHGCTAVAAITAQNSVAVQRVEAVTPDLLDAQLAALAEDLPPRCDQDRAARQRGQRARARALGAAAGRAAPLVVDPVWRATTGAAMVDDGAARRAARRAAAAGHAWSRRTAPRRPGCSARRSALSIRRRARPRSLRRRLRRRHRRRRRRRRSRDVHRHAAGAGALASTRVATRHNHGTGCVFAASMAAALALGFCAADAAGARKDGDHAGAVARPARPAQGAGSVRPRPALRCSASRADAPAGAGPQRVAAFAPIADRHDRPLRDRRRRGMDRAPGPSGRCPHGAAAHQGGERRRPGPRSARKRGGSGAARRAELFVNDHWQLALEHGAYGVHLGQEDLGHGRPRRDRRAGLRARRSSHALWEVCRAGARGAPSYIACGPIHATVTKDMPWRPQGVHNLAYWCARAGHPGRRDRRAWTRHVPARRRAAVRTASPCCGASCRLMTSVPRPGPISPPSTKRVARRVFRRPTCRDRLCPQAHCRRPDNGKRAHCLRLDWLCASVPLCLCVKQDRRMRARLWERESVHPRHLRNARIALCTVVKTGTPQRCATASAARARLNCASATTPQPSSTSRDAASATSASCRAASPAFSAFERHLRQRSPQLHPRRKFRRHRLQRRPEARHQPDARPRRYRLDHHRFVRRSSGRARGLKRCGARCGHPGAPFARHARRPCDHQTNAASRSAGR